MWVVGILQKPRRNIFVLLSCICDLSLCWWRWLRNPTDDLLLSLSNVWDKSAVNNRKLHIKSKTNVDVGHQLVCESLYNSNINDLLTWSRQRFSVLLKDTWTCGLFKPLNLQLIDDPLYHLTLSPVRFSVKSGSKTPLPVSQQLHKSN